jgi:transposase
MLGPLKMRDLDQPVVVSLESLVPKDHFYRHLDRSLDLSFVRDLVRDCYSPIGRPSIDPVVFFRLQLVMFFEGIRSERQLMRVAADRLSVRWYLGYDLHEPLLDHSSLTKIRERYGLEVFRQFFDEIVERCIEAGLVWGKELYFDATKVEANASLDSVKPRFAVEAHLTQLFDDDAKVMETDALEPELLPVSLPETVREDLATAITSRHDWIAEEGRQDRRVVDPDYQRVSDLKASSTDPDSTMMPLKRGVHMGYHVHYAVDGGKARIILQALTTPSEVMENQPMLDLLWRARFRWKLWPQQVTGDTTYGTVENIVAVEDEGIRAYVPLPETDKNSPLFRQRDFEWDEKREVYVCPRGELLRFSKRVYSKEVTVYRAKASTCNACPLKATCTSSSNGRSISRSFHEEYLERVRDYHETEAYKKAMRKRAVWVEPLFGEGKQWHGMGRFRLRRLRRVNIEAQLIAAGQNLKRLLSKRGWGKRHFPGGAAGVAAAPFPLCP